MRGAVWAVFRAGTTLNDKVLIGEKQPNQQPWARCWESAGTAQAHTPECMHTNETTSKNSNKEIKTPSHLCWYFCNYMGSLCWHNCSTLRGPQSTAASWQSKEKRPGGGLGLEWRGMSEGNNWDTRDLTALCLELGGHPISSIVINLSFNIKSAVIVLDKNLKDFIIYGIHGCSFIRYCSQYNFLKVTGREEK